MSLVAYDSSSDDEDNSDTPEIVENESSKILADKNKSILNDETSNNLKHEQISDEESFYEDNSLGQKNNLVQDRLPDNSLDPNLEVNESSLSIHSKLPAPKTVKASNIIVEEDDEFLHKKINNPHIEKPPPIKKKPVKITIPSLNQFMDFSVENKKEIGASPSNKSLSLLALLPQPKNNFFTKNSNLETPITTTKVTNLIPDHVKNKIQDPNKKSVLNNKLIKPIKQLPNMSDSDESDTDDNVDFFSLNVKNKLPEISEKEIKDMVQKKITEMAHASKKIDEMIKPIEKVENEENVLSQNTNNDSVDKNALTALVGASQAKRQKLVDEVQIVDLSSEQILPNRNEWMRNALAAETSYQPRGVLVDEEPAPGTRKKHQITYLAHQAKANEAELQAMWAANRQTRRATASKYGF